MRCTPRECTLRGLQPWRKLWLCATRPRRCSPTACTAPRSRCVAKQSGASRARGVALRRRLTRPSSAVLYATATVARRARRRSGASKWKRSIASYRAAWSCTRCGTSCWLRSDTLVRLHPRPRALSRGPFAHQPHNGGLRASQTTRRTTSRSCTSNTTWSRTSCWRSRCASCQQHFLVWTPRSGSCSHLASTDD